MAPGQVRTETSGLNNIRKAISQILQCGEMEFLINGCCGVSNKEDTIIIAKSIPGRGFATKVGHHSTDNQIFHPVFALANHLDLYPERHYSDFLSITRSEEFGFSSLFNCHASDPWTMRSSHHVVSIPPSF